MSGARAACKRHLECECSLHVSGASAAPDRNDHKKEGP